MKKSDLILAQKSLAARQIKQESQWIKEELQLRASLSPVGGERLRTSHSRQRLGSRSSSSTSLGHSMNPAHSFSTLPDLSRDNSQTFLHKQSLPEHDRFPALSSPNQSLVHTLSQRTLTDATQLRKKQIEVVREVKAREMQRERSTTNLSRPANDNDTLHHARQRQGSRMSTRGKNIFENDRRPYTSAALETQKSNSFDDSDAILDLGDNFFMPKKKVLRPDGASLLDVYESKRSDTWGHIIKAQYQEELEQNEIKRRERERANQEYGTRLKEQLDEKERARQFGAKEDSNFAALEDATAKRTEDLQKQREKDANDRHRQFVENALEDIALKRKKHEDLLRQELTASTIMVNNAKKMIALDEEKKNQVKEAARLYQEQMYQENLDNIARKERQKNDSFAEDRRINSEREAQYRREDQRKREELEARMKRTTEGPAHHIVQKIAEARKRSDDDFYGTISKAENLLNKQLQASESAAKERAHANGEKLEIEWMKNTEFKQKKKLEDEERNAKILATMRQMLQDQEEEDRRNKEKRYQESMRYQRELDAQLHDLRQKSIDSLKKTMNEEEMKYNKQLMQVTAKYLPSVDRS